MPVFPLSAAQVPGIGPLPDHTVWLGLLMLAIGVVLYGVEKSVSIWHKTRPPKPDHEVYATKAELKSAEERLTHDIEQIKTDVTNGFLQIDGRMTQMERTLGNLVNDMARSLGRLEGQLAARMPVIPAEPPANPQPTIPNPQSACPPP